MFRLPFPGQETFDSLMVTIVLCSDESIESQQ